MSSPGPVSITVLWESFAHAYEAQNDALNAFNFISGVNNLPDTISPWTPVADLPPHLAGEELLVNTLTQIQHTETFKTELTNEIFQRTGLVPTINSKHIGLVDTSVPGGRLAFAHDAIHEAPDTLAHLFTRTWSQGLTANKNALVETVQNHRVIGGIASVASIGAGGAMMVDGFNRVRSGLGFNVKQDTQALEGKSSASITQTALGGLEMATGTGLAVLGTYTGLLALRGKGPAPTLAP